MANTKITSGVIADDAVLTANITDANVTTAKIAADAVTSAKVADDAINSEHLAADSIDAEHYAAGSVDATAIASNAVTTAKINDDAVTTAKIADAQITTALMADDSVTSAKLDTNIAIAGTLDVAGAVVFNEGSADVDFRVESNGNANMIFVDGGNDKVGIGVGAPTARLSLPAQASGDSGIARFAIESAVDSNDFTIAQYEDGTGTYTQIGQNISLNSGGNVAVLDSGHKTAGITFDGRGNGALMFQTGAANANTERMRIDSSGNVGIGTTSPNNTLDVNGGIVCSPNTDGKDTFELSTNASDEGRLRIKNVDSTTVQIRAGGESYFAGGDVRIGTTSDLSAKLGVSTTTNMIVGKIDAVNSSYSESVLNVSCNRVTDDAYNQIKVEMRGHSNRLLVTDNGDVENVNNSYGAISDQRLKTDIADASSQWADIKAVKVRKFKYGMEPERGFRLGVISQELEASGMNGLVKEKDADEYQIAYNSDLDGQKVKRVKYSVLYMKAIKALQEAMTRIETLEAKVQTLEDA